MTVPSPQRDLRSQFRGGSDFWDTPAGKLAGEDFFPQTTTTQTLLSHWNGTAWVLKPLRRWNGTAWVDATLKRWNGTTWINV